MTTQDGRPRQKGSPGGEQSSRLFVKGLPRGISEADFRSHFSANGRDVTDIKLIAKRGIGFVGYKSAEEAAKAVKYFHRSFIRMSKLAVELARPIPDAPVAKPITHDSEQPKSVAPETNPKKRKRDQVDESDPRLKEFLEVMQPTRSQAKGALEESIPHQLVPEGDSDGEYEAIPATREKGRTTENAIPLSAPSIESEQIEKPRGDMISPPSDLPDNNVAAPVVGTGATDDEWLRSRTSRLLDLMDVDDMRPSLAPAVTEAVPVGDAGETTTNSIRDGVTGPEVGDGAPSPDPVDAEAAIDTIQRTSRLYVRNLPYRATEGDLLQCFRKFGETEEVHLPIDSSGNSKGYAFVQYSSADDAVKAFRSLDGATFQGRLLHVLPGEAPKYQGLDEFAISKLPLKTQQKIRKRAEAAKTTFSWNSLYMSQDAIKASVAKRLNVSKSDLIDHTSADAAVKQAIAETSVIQEARAYFAANGVDINAFKSQKRGDSAILVKNFPHGTKMEEIRALFEEHGTVSRVLMPPSGTIAIVQFANEGQGKVAFDKLAYARLKNTILFLEKGPKSLFSEGLGGGETQGEKDGPAGRQKLSVTELLERDEEDAAVQTTSLFVKNLSFDTTTDRLAEAFKSLDGFISALVKTKPDAKKPGQMLSMGFGFLEFRSSDQAQAALKSMDGYVLDGHTLSVKVSHRGQDAAEERRRQDKARKAAGQRTKIVIKNLPFEATKKDVRALFGTYGQLRSVRVPKKFGNASRGFAFAEFVTPREAENAVGALRDTHLLGRRLVLDYAEAEAIDPEEEVAKMQRKIGGQANKVALQQLTGRGRQKVQIGDSNEDEFGA